MSEWFEKIEGAVAGARSLAVEGPREATTVDEAWALLPGQGEGWVCLAGEVRRFDPGRREGLLLHAEVADGDRTVVLRHDDGRWRAWTWVEGQGDDHRVIRERFLSSETGAGRGGLLEYATYWTQRDEDGVRVWHPVGSRFAGWRRGS